MGLLNSAFSLEFDAASLARFGAMINAAPIFAAYYTSAMNASVNQVRTRAMTNTTGGASAGGFIDPSGTLMRGIKGYTHSPWLGEVGVGSEIPYARRREFGFSGQTDALGRYYPLDPGIAYLQRALKDSQPFILAAFRGNVLLGVNTIAR